MIFSHTVSSTAMSNSKVSFTIRRPSPVSRAASSGAESDSAVFKVPSLPRHLSNGNSKNGTSSPLTRSSTNSPKPNSRTYYDRDSDEEDEEDEDAEELVTGFDQFGVQRCVLSSVAHAQILSSQKLSY